MPIRLASETPEVEHKGWRANFRWPLEQPWDELRLAAFQMTNRRRKGDSDWTRRGFPFFAALGMTTIECAVPATNSGSLPELGVVLTAELKGIIAGASRIYDDLVAKQGRKD